MTEQLSPDGQWKWDGTQWVPTTFVYGGTPGAPAPPPVAGQPWGPTPPAPNERDWMAILSFVFALLTPVIGFGPIPAVILGHIARHQALKQGRRPSGFATAGLIIGYAFIVLGIIAIVVVVLALSNLNW